MPQKPAVYVSSTGDLRSARGLVGQWLHAMGYEAHWQDVEPTDGGELLGVLRRWVEPCGLMIQLVGRRYGGIRKGDIQIRKGDIQVLCRDPEKGTSRSRKGDKSRKGDNPEKGTDPEKETVPKRGHPVPKRGHPGFMPTSPSDGDKSLNLPDICRTMGA